MRCTALVFFFLTMALVTKAQRPEGQRRMLNPAQMVAAEKQFVLDSVADLNEDQKLILAQIYSDYEAAITKAREEATEDRQAIRTSIMTARMEKDEAIKQLFTEEQFQRYGLIMENRRQRREGPNNNYEKR